MSLLEVVNLKKYFPIKQGFLVEKTVGYVKAVDDVSFSVDKNQTVGIVGESGCGKTTIGKSIVRLHEITDGEVLLNGEDTSVYFFKKRKAQKFIRKNYIEAEGFKEGKNLKPSQKIVYDAYRKADGNLEKIYNILFEDIHEKRKALRRKVQIVFQDPMSSLNPRMTVGQMLIEPLIFHEIVKNRDEAIKVVKGLLEKVGLKSYHVDRYPHQFSGGQRQRIAVARSITVNPELIVLDEPTSALDVSVQAQIVQLLQKLQEDLKAGYIFISHNLALVRFISQIVGVMYLGKMVEYGDSEEVFEDPLHPYTKALLAAAPIPDPDKKRNRKELIGGQVPSPINRPSGCFFHPRCKYKMDICSKEYPEEYIINEKHKVACFLYKK